MVWISQIKDNGRVGLPSAAVRIRSREVDASVEVQRPVGIDVNIQCLEIGGCVDIADRASLHKVVGDDDVLLVGSYFDVVRPNAWLNLVRIVQTLWVFKVGYVQSGDVVRSRDGCFMS